MKKLILLTAFISSIILYSSAQETQLEGPWILDNIELSDFAETEYGFTKESSFFAYFLDKTNTLDLSKPSLTLIVGEEFYTYDIMINKKELHLTSDNTVYIKKNDQPVETKIAIGETIFKIRMEGNRFILYRNNQTFFERYTFISAN